MNDIVITTSYYLPCIIYTLYCRDVDDHLLLSCHMYVQSLFVIQLFLNKFPTIVIITQYVMLKLLSHFLVDNRGLTLMQLAHAGV